MAGPELDVRQLPIAPAPSLRSPSYRVLVHQIEAQDVLPGQKLLEGSSSLILAAVTGDYSNKSRSLLDSVQELAVL